MLHSITGALRSIWHGSCSPIISFWFIYAVSRSVFCCCCCMLMFNWYSFCAFASICMAVAYSLFIDFLFLFLFQWFCAIVIVGLHGNRIGWFVIANQLLCQENVDGWFSSRLRANSVAKKRRHKLNMPQYTHDTNKVYTNAKKKKMNYNCLRLCVLSFSREFGSCHFYAMLRNNLWN